MAGVTESSGLTSLARLREHESRQAQQAEAARARAESEQRARLQSERELLRAERERAERTAAQTAEAQQRAELERLQVARTAELERADRAARGREELERMLVEERGSRRSAELAFTAQVLRQRTLAWLSGALCVASWLGGAGLYFGALRPSAERAVLAVLQSRDEERQARAAEQEASVRCLRRAEELSRRVDSLEVQLRELPAEAPPGSGAPRPTGRRAPHGANVSPSPCRDDGDPLNPCLKR